MKWRWRKLGRIINRKWICKDRSKRKRRENLNRRESSNNKQKDFEINRLNESNNKKQYYNKNVSRKLKKNNSVWSKINEENNWNVMKRIDKFKNRRKQNNNNF